MNMLDFLFFVEVTLSGLMAGVMYSLVALGFVLIFKASGIFNFAQGVMALFAALTLVGLMEKFGFPIWLAIIGTIAVMIALAWLIARPGITAPIASATSLEQLNQLIASTTLDLTQSSIALLDQASAQD